MESAAECGSALPGQITATSPAADTNRQDSAHCYPMREGILCHLPVLSLPRKNPQKQPNPHPDVPEGILPSKVKVLFLADGVQIDLPCNTQSDHAIACQHGGKQLVPDGFPV